LVMDRIYRMVYFIRIRTPFGKSKVKSQKSKVKSQNFLSESGHPLGSQKSKVKSQNFLSESG
jgi:hypothetical protein